MIWPFRKNAAEKLPTRTRIFVSALLLCSLIAAIEMPLPIEGVFRGIRNELRARPADQSIVVAAIDAKTVKALGSSNFSRRHYASLLDQTFASGASRIYFDEAFSLPLDSEGDKIFAQAIAKHEGRVFSGAMHAPSSKTRSMEEILPNAIFSDVTRITSLNGVTSPFSLSAKLSYGDTFAGKVVPSMSADIAGFNGRTGEFYTPDWTIQAASVPTVSFIDLMNGKVPAEKLRGKTVVVGLTTELSDFVQIYGQGWFPGVYVHAIGAQTLKEGTPNNIGWIPPMLAAALLSAAILRVRKRRLVALILATGILLGLVVPFILDRQLISADFISAFLMFGIVAYRSATLRQINDVRLKNAGSMLPNLSALREEPLAATRPIIAMRIRNYAAVCSSFATAIEDELINELARRLSIPQSENTFYQGEDVLYWLAPTISTQELEDHLAGLARLIENQFELRGRMIDIHVTFGVDVDLARTVPNRIGPALLAADNAAAKHRLVQINSTSNDEEAAWELSLMSELDAAIDAGDIWIAYQPQFDLKNDTIIGAEALVRWHHPTRGAISPETFILPAESHNRIKRLTFHILEQATRAIRPLLATHPELRLSVNLSAALLELPLLPAQIANILISTGFPATNLTLEVTESAPFSAHNTVSVNLAGISAIGIDLSIDDYGTGNATLDYLRSVPCNEIKIDRRFVGALTSGANDMMLVQSTIELAHGLGRRVIAEGVEDPETLELLRSIGCDIAQGYYLARPIRLEQMEQLLSANLQTKAA